MPYCRCLNHRIPGPHTSADCPMYDPDDPRISKGLPPYADPYREVGMDQSALQARVSFPDPHAHDFGDARCACGETARALIARCFETMREQADYIHASNTERDALTRLVADNTAILAALNCLIDELEGRAQDFRADAGEAHEMQNHPKGAHLTALAEENDRFAAALRHAFRATSADPAPPAPPTTEPQ